MSQIADYYEDLIATQRREIRLWWIWVILVGLSGAAVVLISVISRASTMPDLLRISAGSFLSACAAFPYKNIPPRRERIVSYQRLRAYFEINKISQEEERQIFMALGLEGLKEGLKRGPNA